jgi:predicted metal-dependent hydrolase
MTSIVALTGAPDWAAAAEDALRERGFSLVRHGSRSGYVARLADDRAALVLVDGDDPGWREWAVLPRANQATRRIPVLVVTADERVRREAEQAGATASLSPGELLTKLPELLTNLARVPDEAQRARLADQCAEPLPPLAQQGLEQFNAGHYYRQHDLFEELWMAEEGPVRDLYQGILQVGVAYYQITRGNYRGALKMLLRSTQWLLALPDVCQGVDVKQLREDAGRVRAALESRAAVDDGEFDLSLLRPVRLVER